MNKIIPLSRKGGAGIHLIIVVFTIVFIVRAFVFMNDNFIFWILGCGVILTLEFFLLRNYYQISFDDHLVYLKRWYSAQIDAVPFESVTKIKLTSYKQGAISYHLLVFKINGVQKKAIFTLFDENYNLFKKKFNDKGIPLESNFGEKKVFF